MNHDQKMFESLKLRLSMIVTFTDHIYNDEVDQAVWRW